MLVTVDGKRWNLVFESPGTGKDGLCDPPTGKKKKIRIAPCLRRDQKRLLEIVIHELLHASDWTKAEEWVETTAEDIARVLWKMGFRQTEPKEL